jgi:crotonobetainyl-CoA:carnitine CoA-transferase CaiB-like acyl-CoA transferase
MVRTIAGTQLVGSPVRLNGARADSPLPPPKLGEHTAEILSGIGLDPPEIERLKAMGIAG